jgi:hypothetical protein
MGKYRTNSRIAQKPLPEGPHVIWRGIGCLMMIIIPAMSIAIAYELINYGLENGWSIPYQLLGKPQMPDWVYKSNGLLTILSPIMSTEHFYAYLALSVVLMIIIGGIISMTYAFVYRAVGPARYGPLDAPPPKIKTKKYTR